MTVCWEARFSMDSVKEELHSDSEDCPMVSPFEEISFVVKHELLPDPETVPLTVNTDTNSAYTEKAEGNLVSETNPLSTHGDLKQEVPSVPLHCPDVKDDTWNSDMVKQEKEDELTVEDHEVILSNEMQLTCHQEELVLGSSLPTEFCIGDISREESSRRADIHGKKVCDFIHMGKKAYKCELCMKEFLKIGCLLRHKTTHTVEESYVCDFCNRRFSRKAYLKAHIRTHTGEKPYRCLKCSKIFTTSSALSRHAQTHLHSHTEENSYRCEVCSKIFTTNSALYGHTRIHSIWSIQS